MRFLWEFGILLLLPIATLQHSVPSSPSYIAGVVEYSPVIEVKNGRSPADQNADNYLKFIDKAASYAVDILVFPEEGLLVPSFKNNKVDRSRATSYVPDPKDKVVPCDDDKGIYEYYLKTISCAARDYGMYIVVNHHEKVDCVEYGCPSDNLLIYNTNVAFDRAGRVIARYRKYNLFGEHGVNITSTPDISTFDTDFGVKFGQFICFDILFQTPALTLTRDRGVRDVIYPTHWFDELPYLFGVQAQAGWAYANDVNLLASGHNNPRTASGGSGIYVGRKGYAHVISEDKASNVLVVSEVPKVINGKRSQNINKNMLQIYTFNHNEISTSGTVGTGIRKHKIDDLSTYTTELIDLTMKSFEKTLCNRGLCCEFKLKINFNDKNITEKSNYYRYRLAAFNGTQNFSGVATGGVESCGIISCINDTLEGCAKLFNSTENIVTPTVFDSIDISIKNVASENAFFMPITFAKDMFPLNATDFSFQSISEGEYFTHRISLTKTKNDLLTFGIFGRNYIRDGSEVTVPESSSTASITVASILLPLILVMEKLINKCIF